jgi:hypothetical protein
VTPLFELHGAGFNNRGGQLMLRTTAERLRARAPVRLCMESLPGDQIGYGIVPLRPSVRPFRQAKPVALFFALSRVAGRVLPPSPDYARRRDPSALIDISGYAFGDSWGARRAANFADRCAYYRRKGHPVVLLPQMLGPFETPAVAAAFRRVLALADRVYARDATSLAAVQALHPPPGVLRRAPDLTIFLADHPAPLDDGGVPYACVVPNMRVLDTGKDKDAWAPVYLDRLEEAARTMRARGLAVRIVVHDASGDDRALAEQLAARIPEATLADDADPIALKALMGGAQLVVGSRFHALVASLSMGVPAVALGWAHKYRMLASDFGLPHLVHGPTDPAGHLRGLVDGLCGDEAAPARASIQAALDRMRPEHDAMWQDVFGVLGI